MDLWEATFYSWLEVEFFLKEMGDKIISYTIKNIPEGYLIEWDGEEE